MPQPAAEAWHGISLSTNSQSEGEEGSVQAALVEYAIGDSGGAPEGSILGSVMERVKNISCDCIEYVNARTSSYYYQARYHHNRAKHSLGEAKRPAKGTGGRIDGAHAAAALRVTDNCLAACGVDCPTIPGSHRDTPLAVDRFSSTNSYACLPERSGTDFIAIKGIVETIFVHHSHHATFDLVDGCSEQRWR